MAMALQWRPPDLQHVGQALHQHRRARARRQQRHHLLDRRRVHCAGHQRGPHTQQAALHARERQPAVLPRRQEKARAADTTHMDHVTRCIGADAGAAARQEERAVGLWQGGFLRQQAGYGAVGWQA